MKSIKADVAIKTLFSRLKEAIVRPLIAPPVPSKPAEKPDNAPPIREFFLFAAITNSLLYKNKALSEIRKTPRKISKYIEEMNLETKPPIITKSTEGIPIYKIKNLFNPFLKSAILLRLLNK